MNLQSAPQHPLSKAGVAAPTVPVANSSPTLGRKFPKEECKLSTVPNATQIYGIKNKKNIVFMSTDVRLKKKDNMSQQTIDLCSLEEENLQIQANPT